MKDAGGAVPAIGTLRWAISFGGGGDGVIDVQEGSWDHWKARRTVMEKSF